MRTYKAQKAALTRAINSGDPLKVQLEVSRFYADYARERQPLPDNWARWDRALQDANMLERRLAWERV